MSTDPLTNMNPTVNRREMLRRTAGAGLLGASGSLLANSAAIGAEAIAHPLLAKAPHIEPKAKRVIVLFMNGGVSHVDSFDPKPELNRRGGQTAPGRDNKLVASLWQPRARGESGLITTDLFPHIGNEIDNICLLRSLYSRHGDHFAATLNMHTGSNGPPLPGLGAWLSYGLGTDNIDLPSHVVFARNEPYAGSQAWSSNFLPAYHQGTRIVPGDEPVPFLASQPGTEDIRDQELAMLRRVNQHHADRRRKNTELAARTLAFDTARSMQRLIPAAFDLSRETQETLDLYGVEPEDNSSFAWQCLAARRMAEAGIRVIEVVDNPSRRNWDTHKNISLQNNLAKNVDQPIAALLRDLRRLGMLDDTLIVWCTEFGRTPWNDGNSRPRGRGHHANAFTCWLAGGGVKGGMAYGSSDELGAEVAENGMTVHDFHATIMHLMGIDHTRLTFNYAGRDFRLTDVHGQVNHEIMV